MAEQDFEYRAGISVAHYWPQLPSRAHPARLLQTRGQETRPGGSLLAHISPFLQELDGRRWHAGRSAAEAHASRGYGGRHAEPKQRLVETEWEGQWQGCPAEFAFREISC